MFGELLHRHPEEAGEQAESPERLKPVVDLEYLESLTEGNETLEDLLREMLDYCYRYVEISIRFKKSLHELDQTEKVEERAELDEETRRVHNATIDSINIFSRALAKEGKDNSWMEKVSRHRATYTRFIYAFVYDELAQELKSYENREAAD